MTMKGELRSVWPLLWQEVWQFIQHTPLLDINEAICNLLDDHELPEDFEPHEDLLVALYPDLTKALRDDLGRRMSFDGADQMIVLLRDSSPDDFKSEASLVTFCENAYDSINEYDDLLVRRYLILFGNFITKYNLRYDLDEHGRLTPTMPGVFSSLFEQMIAMGEEDNGIKDIIHDLNHAYKDLREDRSERRIRIYLQRLTNLAESIATNNPQTTRSTLGAACKEINSWPHKTLQESLSKLYGFVCDYPGIRHAGNAASRQRGLDMRDMVALTAIFAGYIPYLTDTIDCEHVYISAEESTVS